MSTFFVLSNPIKLKKKMVDIGPICTRVKKKRYISSVKLEKKTKKIIDIEIWLHWCQNSRLHYNQKGRYEPGLHES